MADDLGRKWIKVADGYPRAHAKYLVRRDGFLFTATPCYGMHKPWWVPRSMERGKWEESPVNMEDGDEWTNLNQDSPNGR